MKVSLVIATIGRTEELTRLLESLCQQSYQDFEVLICDQNPEGFLDSTLAPFYAQLNITKIAMQPRGVSTARNALFPYITGGIVAFPDDDCWYAPHTLERVVSFFAQHHDVGSLMGVWGEDAKNVAQQAQVSKNAHALEVKALFVLGGTLVQFFRRSIVQKVGTFDEKLGPGTGLPYGCGEDTDYVLRAAQHASIWRVPSVHVYHPLLNASTSHKTKVIAYAYGRMYLLRKHNFSFLFKLANIIFPLYRALQEGPSYWRYRWYMFVGRLQGFFQK